MLAGQEAPKYNHRAPHFPETGLLWWLLSQNAHLQKWNVSNVLHNRNILSFIYCLGWKNILCLLVSFCQECKAGLASRKPDHLYSFLRVTQEMKEKVREAGQLNLIAPRWAARYVRTSRGELHWRWKWVTRRWKGNETNWRKWGARAGLSLGPRVLGASSEKLPRERKLSVPPWTLSFSGSASPCCALILISKWRTSGSQGIHEGTLQERWQRAFFFFHTKTGQRGMV